MPKYRITEKSYIGTRLYEENETIDYNGEHGIAGANLELIEDEAAPEDEAPAKKWVPKAKRAVNAD